jgi:DNA-binding transcriptional regulator/RsmH inhibitor MraZ
MRAKCAKILINFYTIILILPIWLVKADCFFYPYCPMKTGRPTSWNPVASFAKGVWTDVVALASKDRVVLPINVRSQLKWLSAPNSNALAVVEAESVVELRSWDSAGREAMDAIQRILGEASEAERGELAIAAMDRYSRLSFDSAGRAVLPTCLVAHLEAAKTGMIRVVLRDQRLWLWSERKWCDQRSARTSALQAKAASSQ